jgi:hypothetical protein
VVIGTESVPSIEFTAADTVEGLRDRLEAHGLRLVLASAFGQVHDVLATP